MASSPGNEDTTFRLSITERRREQNRTAQRRFRERHQRKAAAEQLQASAILLPSPPQGGDALFQDILLGQSMPSSSFSAAAALGSDSSSSVGGHGMNLCDTSLYGSNALLDDVILLNMDHILTPDSDSAIASPKVTPTASAKPENWEASLFQPPPTDTTDPNPQTNSSSGGGDAGPSGWMSPLHIAAQKGRSRIVLALLQHGADHGAKDSDGLTPLIHATIGGHEEVVNMLLHHGAHVDVVDSQRRSALHWAVMHQHKTVLKALLDHCSTGDQGPVNKYDVDGKMPLHIAIDADFESGVQMLLQCGASVHFKARKPLSILAEGK